MKKYLRQFGGKVTPELELRYSKSDRWIKGRFRNFIKTKIEVPWSRVPGIIVKQIAQRREREPRIKLPILPLDLKSLYSDDNCMQFIWYGHSALFIRVHGKNILVDPMLGPDTTPIAPMSTLRFSENSLDLIDDFPQIDLMLITHDHYDHLDLDSIEKLKSKVDQYFVALGVGRHLEAWGISENKITEFDWWDGTTWSGIDFFFTPTQHFAGRRINDRSMSLWGGWVLNTGSENVWISGDGGYGKHFKEIGEKLGPFDLAFMECGQYNADWRDMHLFPDESIQAAVDAGVKKAIPIHWGAFSLSYQHTWYEPVEHFILSAHENQMSFSSPQLGQVFNIDDEMIDQWWLKYI